MNETSELGMDIRSWGLSPHGGYPKLAISMRRMLMNHGIWDANAVDTKNMNQNLPFLSTNKGYSPRRLGMNQPGTQQHCRQVFRARLGVEAMKPKKNGDVARKRSLFQNYH